MERNIYKSLLRHLEKKEYTIITGARQTGKSTLLRQMNDYCKSKSIPSAFINLENKNILSDFNDTPLNLLSYLPETEERVVVFIDEIQYLKDPSNFLKLIYDEYADRIKIVATGSSAFYMDTRFNDSLAGRKKIFCLLTCSFDECLRMNGKEELLEDIRRIQADDKAKSLNIELLRQEWETYMTYGGYPAVIKETDKKEKTALLAEIRDSFVKRDIIESGVQNETAFYHLFRILASQAGNLVNVNELSVSLRIKNETVSNYLMVLQKCFHIVLVKPFFMNLRKELTKMPKAYMLDTGLMNSLINNFQPFSGRLDKGLLWENMYFRVLCDMYGMDEIFFWRTADGNEVDYVLPRIEKPAAFEAKADYEGIKEHKYIKFREAYPDIPLSFRYLYPFDEEFFRKIYYFME